MKIYYLYKKIRQYLKRKGQVTECWYANVYNMIIITAKPIWNSIARFWSPILVSKAEMQFTTQGNRQIIETIHFRRKLTTPLVKDRLGPQICMDWRSETSSWLGRLDSHAQKLSWQSHNGVNFNTRSQGHIWIKMKTTETYNLQQMLRLCHFFVYSMLQYLKAWFISFLETPIEWLCYATRTARAVF